MERYLGHYKQLSLFLLIISGISAVNIPPKITRTSSKDIYYKVGETVKIVCEASGNPKPEYSWKKSQIDFQPSGNSKRIVQLQDKGTLVINSPEDKDESIYQCFADNGFGRAASIKYNVRMAKLDSFNSNEPVIHTPNLGDYLRLRCNSPDSVPDPSVFWAIRQDDGSFDPIDWNSTMSVDYEDQLHIAHVTKDNYQDDKSYHCVVWNDRMRDFKAGPPHYIRPRGASDKITRMRKAWPKSKFDELGILGTTHKLKCIFSGNPTPLVRWSRADGQPLPDGSNSASSGGQELILQNIRFQDAGVYVCSATSDDSSTPLEMSISLSVQSVPEWVKKPVDVNIAENATATFECAGTGVPTPQIRWYVNGMPLENALRTDTRLDKRFKRVRTDTVSLEYVTISDTMVFQCNVTNSHGYVWGEAYLNVIGLAAPSILEKPKDELKVAEGQDFELPCNVTGNPEPIVTWFKNDQQITGGRFAIMEKGNLFVRKAVTADSGLYRCHAKNRKGEKEAQGYVVVRRKTVIEQKPRDLELKRGMYAKFTCSGTTDPEETHNMRTYWIKDQQIVELGARMFQNIQDNSLTISGTEQRDTGTFTCVVTNGIDEDKASARLVVTDVPNPAVKIGMNNTCLAKNRSEVSWIPGSFNNAPIQYYTVEYTTSKDPDNWVFATKVSQTKAKAFISLANGLTYSFRVTAVNKIGSSKPSAATTAKCVTREDYPNKNPRNVRTLGNSPGFVHVEWTPVPPENQGGSGFRYFITFHKVGDSEKNDQTQEIFNWREYKTFWPSDGKIYQPYDISVQSVNKAGPCTEQVVPIRGYSAEGRPDTWPREFQTIEIHSEFVRFQWRFPSDEIGKVNTQIKGEFRGFKIQVWETSSPADTIRDWDLPPEMFSNVTGDVYTASIFPLLPNTKLAAHVSVMNNFYVSKPSDILTFQTLPGLPGPVAYMEAATIGDNHINLIWDQPLDSRNDIIGFDIGYQRVRGLFLEEMQERVPQIDDSFATTAMLSGLVPLTKYRIHIWARTAAGRGESYFIERTTGSPGSLEMPRYRIKDVGSDFINVSWFKDPYKQSNSIVFVQYKKEDGAEWFSTSPDVSREWVKLSPLEAGTTYSIRVVATNGKERRLSVEEDVTTDGLARAYDIRANLGWFLAMIFSLCLHIGLVIALCVLYQKGFRLKTREFSAKTYTSGGQTFTGTTDNHDDFPRNSSDFGPEPPGFSNDYYDDKDSYEDHEKGGPYKPGLKDDDRGGNDSNGRHNYYRSDDDSDVKTRYEQGDHDDRHYDDPQGHGYDYGTDEPSSDSPRYEDDYRYDNRNDDYWDNRDDRHHPRDDYRRGARYDDGPMYDDHYDYDRNNGRYEDVQTNRGIPVARRYDDYPVEHRHRHGHDDDPDHDHDKCRSVVEEVNKRLSGEPITAQGSTRSDNSTAV